jgi:hypothetical protein
MTTTSDGHMILQSPLKCLISADLLERENGNFPLLETYMEQWSVIYFPVYLYTGRRGHAMTAC